MSLLRILLLLLSGSWWADGGGGGGGGGPDSLLFPHRRLRLRPASSVSLEQSEASSTAAVDDTRERVIQSLDNSALIPITNTIESSMHRNVQEQPPNETFTATNDMISRSSIMDRCYHDLSQVSQDNTTLTQMEYVNLVRNITNGQVNVTGFAELPALYVMIFYGTACAEDDTQCDQKNVTVAIARTPGTDYNNLVFFCTSLYTETMTQSSVAFEYTIQYDPKTISTKDIPACLATATKRALLSGLGCEYPKPPSPTKRKRNPRALHSYDDAHTIQLDVETVHVLQRLLQQETTSMSMSSPEPTNAPSMQSAVQPPSNYTAETCPYDVTVRVPTLVDFGKFQWYCYYNYSCCIRVDTVSVHVLFLDGFLTNCISLFLFFQNLSLFYTTHTYTLL
jgi:hypothetical protein